MVKENMCFVDFDDFYVRREIIRALYQRLSIYDKTVYKYYVYSRRLLREKICDIIWEYLNVPDGEDKVVCQTNLSREYHKYHI